VEQIVSDAGYTKGAFYANFHEKSDLFLTVLEAQRERDFGRLSTALDDAPEEEVPARISDWMNQVLIGGPLRRAMAEFALAAKRAHHIGDEWPPTSRPSGTLSPRCFVAIAPDTTSSWPWTTAPSPP
jgi:AcrR family transcriptional regulator